MKRVKNRLTIILAHYNQMKYIETSIFSVLHQNHDNIELIITDDCSSYFDKKKIEDYVNQNKKNNLKSFQIIINDENKGTVKTLNNALDYVTGEFVLFFAADDELNNKGVVSSFIRAFENKNKNIITSQSLMYDETLAKCRCKYVNAQKALKNNLLTPMEQYEILSKNCIYSSGSTAYRMSVFDKYGKFNDTYKLVEDWAYWVYITRTGEKLYYYDFDTLNHREGGVSHNSFTPENAPAHIRAYYTDILDIFNNEIIAYIDLFDEKAQIEIFEKFKEHINYYGDYIGKKVNKYLITCEKLTTANNQFAKNYQKKKKKLRINALFKVHIVDKFRHYFIRQKTNDLIILIWLMMALIVTRINIFNNEEVLYYYFLSFIIINYIINFIKKGSVLYIITLLLTGILSKLLNYYNVVDNSYIMLIMLPIIFIIIYYILYIPMAEIRKIKKNKQRKDILK